jgi:hypothetical protein
VGVVPPTTFDCARGSIRPTKEKRKREISENKKFAEIRKYGNKNVQKYGNTEIVSRKDEENLLKA